MEASGTTPGSIATAEPAEPVAEPQATPQTSAEQDGERDETGRYLSREAANYRRRLRDTEAERDSLREQLDRVQRVEVERLAATAGLAVASDIWMHGATVETLRGDNGDIDSETVTGVVADIVKDRPGLAAATPPGDIGIGRGGAAAARRPEHVGLSALLKPEAR